MSDLLGLVHGTSVAHAQYGGRRGGSVGPLAPIEASIVLGLLAFLIGILALVSLLVRWLGRR